MSTGVMTCGIARRSSNDGEVCGDMAGCWSMDGLEFVVIADGLGHGKDAAAAAAAALAAAELAGGRDLIALFQRMNIALRQTRGAAVGLAIVDWAAGHINYAAVGNTRAALFGERTTRLDACPGIVGGAAQRLTPVAVPFQSGDCWCCGPTGWTKDCNSPTPTMPLPSWTAWPGNCSTASPRATMIVASS